MTLGWMDTFFWVAPLSGWHPDWDNYAEWPRLVFVDWGGASAFRLRWPRAARAERNRAEKLLNKHVHFEGAMGE